MPLRTLFRRATPTVAPMLQPRRDPDMGGPIVQRERPDDASASPHQAYRDRSTQAGPARRRHAGRTPRHARQTTSSALQLIRQRKISEY